MLDEQMDIRDKLKPIERRLPVLKKHKGKKKLSEAEQIRKSVYSILRQEQRERQPRKEQDRGL